MPDFLETALTRTLSEAADAAPEQPVDLLDRVDTGFRRRRRRRHSVVAGVATLAVILGSAVWAGQATTPPQPDRAALPPIKVGPPVDLPRVKPAKPPAAAKMWPEAYHTISSELPDGRDFWPQLMINDRQVLALTQADRRHPQQLWIIDVPSNTARLAADMPDPDLPGGRYAHQFSVGSGYVVWRDTENRAGVEHTRIWKLRLPGSDPVLVSTVRGVYSSGVSRLAVHRDTVLFADDRGRGVWQVPLVGGDARRLPGTEGLHILASPWIGDCSKPLQLCTPVLDDRLFTVIRNVDTGERRTVSPPTPDVDDLVCGLTYCHALASGSKWILFPRDGRWQRELPDQAASVPILDRFLTIGIAESVQLYDIKTGRLAYLGDLRTGAGGGPVFGENHPEGRMLAWRIVGQKTLVILDLAAIK